MNTMVSSFLMISDEFFIPDSFFLVQPTRQALVTSSTIGIGLLVQCDKTGQGHARAFISAKYMQEMSRSLSRHLYTECDNAYNLANVPPGQINTSDIYSTSILTRRGALVRGLSVMVF